MEDADSDAEMADYGTYVNEAKHVAHDISARLSHWEVPTSASNLAQSREADDSSMFLSRTLNRSRMQPASLSALA